jgi:hypothetical protein
LSAKTGVGLERGEGHVEKRRGMMDEEFKKSVRAASGNRSHRTKGRFEIGHALSLLKGKPTDDKTSGRN